MTVTRCPRCGNKITPKQRFCQECGLPLREADQVSENIINNPLPFRLSKEQRRIYGVSIENNENSGDPGNRKSVDGAGLPPEKKKKNFALWGIIVALALLAAVVFVWQNVKNKMGPEMPAQRSVNTRTIEDEERPVLVEPEADEESRALIETEQTITEIEETEAPFIETEKITEPAIIETEEKTEPVVIETEEKTEPVVIETEEKTETTVSDTEQPATEKREPTEKYTERKYLVTVENGTGGGYYSTGEKVQITAEIPEDSELEFSGWEITSGDVPLSDKMMETAYFIMPKENVSVKAGLSEKKYTVTVKNGKGGGRYPAGDKVTLAADEPENDYVFDKWETVSGDAFFSDPTSESAYFYMPAEDVEIEAKYSKKEYSVSVNRGTGSGNYKEGDQVFIAADPAEKGEVFDKWNVVYGDAVLASSSSDNTFFTMPASNVSVNAAYVKKKYSVTVENGSGDNSYSPGDTVYISADDAPSGQLFDKWSVTSENVVLLSSQNAWTSFTMPDEDVSVKALYRERLYSVTVTKGTGSGSFSKGQTVSIKADDAETGEIFDRWNILTGNVTLASSGSQSTTFTMPSANVYVEAVYKKKSYSVTVSGGTGDASKYMGDTVYISADAPEAGYVFSSWEVTKGSLGYLSNSENTSFTMPAGDVNVAARYEPYEADTGLHRYRFVKDDCTWKEAFQKAKEAGGYLVNINSKKEYSYLVSEIERLGYEKTMFKIGGRRDLSSKDYYWVDRQDQKYGDKLNSSSSWASDSWYKTEPSYTDTVDGKKIDEPYLEFYKIDGKWQWFDVPDNIVKVVPNYSGRLGYIIEFNN